MFLFSGKLKQFGLITPSVYQIELYQYRRWADIINLLITARLFDISEQFWRVSDVKVKNKPALIHWNKQSAVTAYI